MVSVVVPFQNEVRILNQRPAKGPPSHVQLPPGPGVDGSDERPNVQRQHQLRAAPAPHPRRGAQGPRGWPARPRLRPHAVWRRGHRCRGAGGAGEHVRPSAPPRAAPPPAAQPGCCAQRLVRSMGHLRRLARQGHRDGLGLDHCDDGLRALRGRRHHAQGRARRRSGRAGGHPRRALHGALLPRARRLAAHGAPPQRAPPQPSKAPPPEPQPPRADTSGLFLRPSPSWCTLGCAISACS